MNFATVRARSRRSILSMLAGLGLAGTLAAQGQQFVQRTTDMAQPRAFHGSAVMGDFLYMFGGSVAKGPGATDEGPSGSVSKSRILEGGRLGPWEETTPLPQPRLYIGASTLVLNDVVYIVGGSNRTRDGERYNTAIYSRPLPNGTLLPWAESAPYSTTGLSTMAAVSTPGHIHVIGGMAQTADVPTTEVWTNPIYSDGSMGAWVAGPPMPVPLWFHSAGTAGGRVYVWGGLQVATPGAEASPAVLSAPILGSGKLGAWRRERTTLPQPFNSASSATAGPYLMSFSPRYPGKAPSSDVWFATAGPGGLSAFSGPRDAEIPIKLYHAAATDYRRGTIFVSGGRAAQRNEKGGETLPNVHFFQLSGQARELAEKGWVAANQAHLNTVAAISASNGERATTLSYIADSAAAAIPVAGFKPYGDARREAEQGGRPLVLYFNTAVAAPCVEQAAILKSPEFQKLTSAAAFGWVDTEAFPQIAQQLGVWRVPTWVFFDKSGNEAAAARTAGVLSAEELARAVTGLQ